MLRIVTLSIALSITASSGLGQSVDLATSYYHFSLAKLLEANEQFDEAVAEMEKALAANPESASLLYQYASTLLKANDVTKAIAQAEKSIELDPENPNPHFLLGQIYKNFVDRGRGPMADKAVASFERTVELDPRNFEALFYLGQLYLVREDHEKVVTTFGRLIEVRTDIPKAWLLRAQSMLALSRNDEAVATLEEAVTQVGDDVEILVTLAQLYDQLGRSEDALEIYQRASQKTSSPEIRGRVTQLLMQEQRFKEAIPVLRQAVADFPSQVRFRIELGKALDGARQYVEAVSVLTEAAKLAPADIEANYFLANSLRALGRFDDAIDRIEFLIEAAETGANPAAGQFKRRFQLFLATLYQDSRDFGQAIELFARLSEEDPEDLGSRLGWIDALEAADELNEALERSTELYQANKEEDSVLVTHARVLSAADRLDEAIRLLEDWMKKSPDQETVYLVASQLMAEKNRFDEAIGFVERGLVENPDSIRMFFQLGAVYERKDDVKLAEEHFQKVLEAEPDHAGALNYLGYMLADRGLRLEEALGYIERALEDDPFNGAYLDSLGWVYYKMDRLDLAKENLVQAAEISWMDPTILMHLGDVYNRLGNQERARAYYERSVSFAKDPKELEEARDRLESLSKTPPSGNQ